MCFMSSTRGIICWYENWKPPLNIFPYWMPWKYVILSILCHNFVLFNNLYSKWRKQIYADMLVWICNCARFRVTRGKRTRMVHTWEALLKWKNRWTFCSGVSAAEGESETIFLLPKLQFQQISKLIITMSWVESGFRTVKLPSVFL